jgi:hypothetical protein
MFDSTPTSFLEEYKTELTSTTLQAFVALNDQNSLSFDHLSENDLFLQDENFFGSPLTSENHSDWNFSCVDFVAQNTAVESVSDDSNLFVVFIVP